jgi:hypothetical protein
MASEVSCFRTKRALLAGKKVSDQVADLRLVAHQHFLAAARNLEDMCWIHMRPIATNDFKR